MWLLISAVVTASLLGSMHCVGMCGPLAIWASGAGEGRRGRQLAVATTLYHLGRLMTYALAGLIAGGAGQLVDLGLVGSGLTDESSELSYWDKLPVVIQIEYSEQFDTGKYQFPVFVCKHGDKDPREVVYES